MEKQDNYLTLVKDDGTEVRAQILFTHHSVEFAKDYVVFLPEDSDSVAAASYVETQDGGTLDQITTEAEWDLIEKLLRQYVDSQESSCDCGGGCCCCEGDCGCDCEGDCDEEGCSCQENCCGE